jgi:hypothetical protein
MEIRGSFRGLWHFGARGREGRDGLGFPPDVR